MKNSYSKFISKSVFIILIIFIFCTFFTSIEIEDIWWHLKTGQWIWTHKLVPNYDLFPFFNGVKTHWLCNFEWLGSTIYYLIYSKFGFLGLKFFRPIFFLSIIGVFYFYSRRVLPYYLLAILVYILTYGCSQRGFLRPEAFDYVFIQIFLIILFSFEKTSKKNILFILPILGIFWANLHLGSFVYGVPLISIFLLSALVKFANEKLNNTLAVDRQLSQVKYLAFILIVYLFVFFVTPYGLEGFLYPFRAFLDPGFINIYQSWSTIQESRPPSHFEARLIILFLLSCVFLFLNRRNAFTALLLFVVSLFFYLQCQRNIVFFSILALYGIVENANAISFKEKYKSFFKGWHINLFLLFFSIFLLFQIFNMATQKWYCDGKFVRRISMVEDPRFFAVRKLLQDNKITGPVYNNHDLLGGWLIWSGYPQWRVFVDGRHARDNERTNDSNLIFLDPKQNWPIAEQKYGFKIAVLDSWFPSLGTSITKYFSQLPDWQLIYANGPILVYVKKGQFQLSDDLDQYSAKLKSINVEKKDIEQLKRLWIAREKDKSWDITNQLSSDTDILLSGAALYVLGYKGAGIKYLIESLKVGKDKPLLPFIRLVLIENMKVFK
jgi:hypothetical protein